MNYSPFLFTVVPHEGIAFSHHLELGPLHYESIFSSVQGPFLRADEELGRSREVVDLFKSEVVKFACVLFQVQDYGAYTIGIYDPPNFIDFCIVPFF